MFFPRTIEMVARFGARLALGISVFLSVSHARAEDLQKIFDRVKTFVEQKNYPKAIEELAWARKEIEKANNEQLKTFFPDEIEGFKGGEIKSEGAFGISNLERKYTKDGAAFEMSLTGAGSGGGGMGGLAQFGKMAAMMGMQQDAFRVQGFTATLEEKGQPELSIFLDSGSVIKLEARKGVKSEDLKAIAEGFKLTDLDKYLRGQ